MPRYEYKCNQEGCERVFQVFHSMSEKFETCDQCTGDCDKSATVNKVLHVNKRQNLDYKKNNKKVGSVVRSSIEEIKKDISVEKKKFKAKLYDG